MALSAADLTARHIGWRITIEHEGRSWTGNLRQVYSLGEMPYSEVSLVISLALSAYPVTFEGDVALPGERNSAGNLLWEADLANPETPVILEKGP